MGTKREPFLPNTIYHVYNHGIGDSDIFFEPANYEYFLDLFKKHIEPFTKLFAFCLLPNHFHLILKTGNYEQLEEHIKSCGYQLSGKRYLKLNNKIAQIFGNFFNAYAKAVNKRYRRMGGIFVKSCKRKIVKNNDYVRQLILYVNTNPIHHHLVEEIDEWKYSSYSHIIHKNSFVVDVNQTLSFFSSIEEFRILHENYINEIKKAGKTGPFNLETISLTP